MPNQIVQVSRHIYNKSFTYKISIYAHYRYLTMIFMQHIFFIFGCHDSKQSLLFSIKTKHKQNETKLTKIQPSKQRNPHQHKKSADFIYFIVLCFESYSFQNPISQEMHNLKKIDHFNWPLIMFVCRAPDENNERFL